MNHLGPYITYSPEGDPTHWCYFHFDDHKTFSYYTAPYQNNTTTHWTKTPLEDNQQIYLYDPDKQARYCYFSESGRLYRAPIARLNGQDMVRVIEEVKLIDNDFSFSPIKTKPREKEIAIEYYPSGAAIQSIQHAIPDLLQEHIRPTTPVQHYLAIDDAKALLQISQCSIIRQEEDCPASLAPGTMVVWEKEKEWCFKTHCLGEIKSGVFDNVLDKDVIAALHEKPLGEVELSPRTLMHMNRPYLKLNPAQQATIIQTIAPDWPLSNDVSAEEQRTICQAILSGAPLSKKDIPDAERFTVLDSHIHAFRPYLFPSTINALFENKLYTDIQSEQDPTIADVIVFISDLLIASAQALGDKQVFSIKPLPNSHVRCGQLPTGTSARLIFQGLSEQDDQLFQLILNYESQGINALSIQDLVQLSRALDGITNNHSEYTEVAKDLLVSVQEEGQSQNDAKKTLDKICNGIQRDISKQLLKELILAPEETLKAHLSLLSKPSKILTIHKLPGSISYVF